MTVRLPTCEGVGRAGACRHSHTLVCPSCVFVLCMRTYEQTVSPCHIDADETVSTLNYANMAKMIINEPQQNSKTEALGGTLERTETSAATAQSVSGSQRNALMVALLRATVRKRCTAGRNKCT